MSTVRAPALHVWEDYFAHLGEKRMQFNSNLGQLMYIDFFLWYRQHGKHNELCVGLSIKACSKMSQKEKSALHDSQIKGNNVHAPTLVMVFTLQLITFVIV